MVSRCPSCGSPTPEDEKVCPSCGWDFVARKRTKPEAGRPVAPPTPPPPPAAGGFALPPARNLNSEPIGLKPLPKLEPREEVGPAEGENPFTLPAARCAVSPAAPPEKALLYENPAPKTPPPAAKEPDGLGARLFRSLRGEGKPAQPPAVKPADVAQAPDAPERKGFSLPPARIIEGDEAPVERPREEKPLPVEAPADDLGREEVRTPPPAEPLLPTSARDMPVAPPRSEPAAFARVKAQASAPAAEAPSAAESRKSMVMIAAIAGAALGTVSVLAVYLLMRPDTSPGSSGTLASPFGRPGATAIPRPDFPPAPGAAPTTPTAAPAPVVAPAPPAQQSPAPLLEAPSAAPAPLPKPAAVSRPIVSAPAAPPPAPAPAPDLSRPSATFGATPRLVVTGERPAHAAKPQPATPAAPAAAEPKRRKPKGPRWVFEGVVFDLLTARGVFGAKLVFVNPEGDVVGETDTGPAGRYKVSLPAGSGYKLKISHADYTDRYIDEGDATSSLREATPEERRILMSAAARNLPWTGEAAKPMHRDLALVPRTPEEP